MNEKQTKRKRERYRWRRREREREVLREKEEGKVERQKGGEKEDNEMGI